MSGGWGQSPPTSVDITLPSPSLYLSHHFFLLLLLLYPPDAQTCLSQMPIVLIPIHFDRDIHHCPVMPSCQRSIVIRTFITSDFMTGIPATPGQHWPKQVCIFNNYTCIDIIIIIIMVKLIEWPELLIKMDSFCRIGSSPSCLINKDTYTTV